MPAQQALVVLFLALCVTGVASAQARAPAPGSSADRAGVVDESVHREGLVSAFPPVTARIGQAAPPAQQTQADPTWDGAAVGALIGAGAGLGLTALLFASCDAGCEGPSVGPTYLLTGAAGAGTGALLGWLVDRARTGRPRTVDVGPVITTREKSIRVSLRF